MTTLAAFLRARIAEDEKAATNFLVLTECEARTAIVDAGASEEALRYLALPYADHADYDERWKP